MENIGDNLSQPIIDEAYIRDLVKKECELFLREGSFKMQKILSNIELSHANTIDALVNEVNGIVYKLCKLIKKLEEK